MKRPDINIIINMILSILFLLFLCPQYILAIDSPATAYYVSPQGADSNIGTKLSPWRTIQKAADTVKPGDTVYIRGGIYQPNERIKLRVSGSEGKYITFMNYPGEIVTIDGAGLNWGYSWDCLFDLNSQSYIRIIGLRVINSNWIGIGAVPNTNGCQHVIIKNCSTFNTKSSGIAFYHGKDITIEGNTVEQACTGFSATQECISLAAIDLFLITKNHVLNCTNIIPGAGGEGINVKDGCSNGVICYNTVNNISKVGLYIDAYSKHQYNIEVHDNTIYNTADGIAVATENGGFLENIKVNNNLIYNCLNWGFVVAGWGNKETSHGMKEILFHNNTIYNPRDGGIHLNNSEAENIVITNNTISANPYTYSVPILANGAKLSEINIYRNILKMLGFNYTLTNNCPLIERTSL